MRLNTEEEAGCKRGGPPTVATPRLRSRPFSPQLISARGARLRTFFGVHLEVEYGGGGGCGGEELFSHRGGKRKRRERKEGGAGLPEGPPTLAPGACRARASRARTTLSRATPSQPGRSPHTRGGAAGAPRHESPTQEKGSTHRSKPSPAAAPPGATSRPPWGRRRRRRRCLEQPPKQSQAGSAATAVTSRTGRRRPSLAGPAAQAAWPCARALLPPPPPPVPARSPPTLPLSRRAIRARALAPAPPPGLLTRSPSALRARVRAPVCSDEVWIPLPRNGTRRTCGSRPATLHSPPPRCIRQPPQEAERVFLRLPGTSSPPPSPRFSRASHTTQGPVPSLQRSSSALTPTVTLRERRLALRSQTWASPPTRAPPAASSPEPVPAPPNCRLGPPTPQRERTRVGASLRFPTVWEPGAPL
ncbi:dapper homolog 3-like [Herpailurus yagouaroundi]|uniref:dapper homolog 3-like n=1 Tax=Herpailurus yagouaroundi TaxID=1608482 RepID=UPI001AD7A1FB|nr:dapper homolog 3-like [Puma yagouaroundi]XP_040340351.1 dapper homolog 3-like [Puma yagouaroundi]